jgi:hypothetical protein
MTVALTVALTPERALTGAQAAARPTVVRVTRAPTVTRALMVVRATVTQAQTPAQMVAQAAPARNG